MIVEYNVYRRRTGEQADANVFYLRAPMSTIRELILGHFDAEKRILREFKQGKLETEVHHNGRGPHSGFIHTITMCENENDL